MIRKRWFVLVTLTVVLITAVVSVGYLATSPRVIEATLLQGPYRILVYRGGQPVREKTLALGTVEERTVADWLTSHTDGWQPSFVTYVPGRLIRGDCFNFNLHPNGFCILNYGLPDQPRQQVVRRVSVADAGALVTATGGE